MKKFNYIILSMIIATLFSCDLDRFPESDLSDNQYWQTEGDFIQALNSLYRSVPGWNRYNDDNQSDIQVGNATNNISDGTYQPTSGFGPWGDSYEVIRAANNIIEKLETVDLGTKASLEAEARFFRALQYYTLVKAYGDVPLILKTLDITSEELFAPRDDRKVVIDKALADLDFAADKLPSKASVTKGRLTKGAANALKARIALYEGTRSKFHGYGYEQELLTIARDAAKKVMDSQEYSLYAAKGNGYDNYTSLFLYDGEGSDETILAHEYGISEANQIASFNNRNLEQGGACATRKLMDSYLCTDGLPIDKSPLFQGFTEYSSEFENRDPRLTSVILKRGDDLKGENAPWVPTIYSSLSGVLFKKYAYPADWVNQRSYIDWMFIRYAETLLIYAEATY
ncbi:MAG: RagB/SusD family nutrient uptake outer membrane protein [Bacteroidales bacterium]